MFRAYDAKRERLVAVKVFHLDLPPERAHQLVAQFEQLIAADLTHPAMAVPLATGITGASAYLAQDYVAAESLDLTVREYGPAPPADALGVVGQLAGALDFAAIANINHGALHPRDVILSSDETRLTGVGVARALEGVGVVVPVRHPYTAPERIAGAPWDRRADIFSLAALMHELLWGRRISGTGLQAIEEATELPGARLAPLQSAFARALADNPEDRFETAREFAEALKEAFPNVVINPQSPASSRKSRSRLATGERHAAAQRLPLDELEMVSAEPDEVREPAEFPEPGFASGPMLDLHALEIFAAEASPTAVHTHEPTAVRGRSRSAVWPLMAALVIGLALGFAGGYAVASRERLATTGSLLQASAGHESTEVAVSEPPKATLTVPATPPKATPAAPVVGTPRSGAAIINTPPPKGEATPGRRVGSLLVRSTPAGARVIVDGEDSGRTPVTVRDLEAGVHRLRIQHEGYVTEDRRVTLTRARPTQSMTIALARPRTTPPASAASPSGIAGRVSGALAIESRPEGAKAYLDGRLVGTTPLSLDRVQAGEHTIYLELDGFRGWSSSIRVVATENNRVTAALER